MLSHFWAHESRNNPGTELDYLQNSSIFGPQIGAGA